MNDTDKAMMSIIRQSIADKAPMPVERDLMVLLGVMSGATTQDSLRRLRRAGVIDVRVVKGRRVVRIIETGEETAEPETGSARLCVDPEPAHDVSQLPRVNRDPCGFCGVRADIGCRHSVQVWSMAA